MQRRVLHQLLRHRKVDGQGATAVEDLVRDLAAVDNPDVARREEGNVARLLIPPLTGVLAKEVGVELAPDLPPGQTLELATRNRPDRLLDHVPDPPAGVPDPRLSIEIDEHTGEMLFILILVRVDMHVLGHDRVQPQHDLPAVEFVIPEDSPVSWNKVRHQALELLDDGVRGWLIDVPYRQGFLQLPALLVGVDPRPKDRAEFLQLRMAVSIECGPKIVVDAVREVRKENHLRPLIFVDITARAGSRAHLRGAQEIVGKVRVDEQRGHSSPLGGAA